MTDQQRIIQRLWYTAPSRIDSNGRPVQGGERFRRCATTDSLNEDIYKGGAQVRALERYTLYTPPDDTARDDVSVYDEVPDLEATNKSDVPICLALLDILHPEVLDDEKLREQLRGRVLVNKLYLGRVGDGREGNVFIDLLACLPEGFSAREALALWRAPDFWRQHYASTHAGSMFRLPPVELPSALLNEIARRQARRPQSSGVLAGPGAARPGEYAPYGLLRNPFAQISLTPGTEKQLTEVLTFLIHAYLLQQHEEWTENNTIARDLSTVKKELEDMRRVKQKTGFINANIGISGQIKKKEEEQRQIEAIQLQKKLHFKRIYLAVEDDQAAYGLTLLARLLQDMPALLQPLTFSTYEYKVLDSDCLIVCTSASRAGEKDHQKVEKLLPDECKKLGFVYNAYDTANNPKLAYQLPFNPGQFQMGTYRVESVARNLARQLLRPTEKFDRYVQEVAVQISANGSGSPAQQLVEHWQKKLVAEDLLNKPYISRGEAIRMFEDPQWWECLEEPVLARQVWQWAIADCKGLDLDEASQSWFTRRDREAAGVWLSQTLLPAIEFFVRRRAMEPTVGPIAAFIAKNLGELLVEYADNLVQPALYNSDEIPAHQSPVASTHTRFDVIIAQKRERDPEAFEALLRTLQRCEPAMQGAPTWTYLLSYLFTSSLTSKNQRTFLHLEAGSFVLRPLYDTALQMEIDEHDTRPLANMARCHWNIHMRLLQYAIQVLPESLPEEQSMLQSRPLDLIMPLLQIPLQRYLSVFGKGEAQGWYLSWRREALDYQIDQFRHNGQIYRFTGHYGDYYRVTSRDTQLCRDFIGKPEHWPTHLLLVLEAMACLDDWEDALPLLEPDVPPFQPELVRHLDTPGCALGIQRVIFQQIQTGHAEKIEAVMRFHEKLVQSGYSEVYTLALLDTWWENRAQIPNADKIVDQAFKLMTNRYQNSVYILLGKYKEELKGKQFESILIDLYTRYAQQTSEENRPKALFRLLDGQPVSQAALDALLALALPSRLEKIEFFARFGPIYLTEYFKHKRLERSKELFSLFTSLIDAEQDVPNQTMKPGQQFVSDYEWRDAILAIFWLWLSAAGSNEAEFIKVLFQRMKPKHEELIDLLATFGGAYMLSLNPDLMALCQRELAKLFAQKPLSSAEKLQLCLTLLQPESFPLMAKALPVDQALAVLQAAPLTQERSPSLINDLHKRLMQQELRIEIQAQKLVNFLDKYRRGGDDLFKSLNAFWAKDTERVIGLARDAENFIGKQYYPQDYQANELELFLELQEYRARGKQPPGNLPLALYLRYLEASDRDQVKLAEPFKDVYRLYLQNFSIESFAQRQGTIALLNSLAGTAAHEKTIDALSNALLTVNKFLQTCQRITYLIQHPGSSEKEDEPTLSTETIKDLGDALRQMQQACLHLDVFTKLEQRLVMAVISCISDKSDVLRVLKLGPVFASFKEKSQGSNAEMILLLQMCREANRYYSQFQGSQFQGSQQLSEWFVPYLEILPSLKEELGIKKDLRGHWSRIMEALLFKRNEPDELTVLALDAYMQRANNAGFSWRVVQVWNEYKVNPWIDVLLKATATEAQPTEYLGSPNFAPVDNSAQQTIPEIATVAIGTGAVEAAQPIQTLPAFADREQESSGQRVSWSESFSVVRKMRKAIRQADREEIKALWRASRKRDILFSYQQQIGRVHWECFQALRQLDEAYLALLAEYRYQTAKRREIQEEFRSCVDHCDQCMRGKILWTHPVSGDQRGTYKGLPPSEVAVPQVKTSWFSNWKKAH